MKLLDKIVDYIIEDRARRHTCMSCENLKEQLALANRTIDKLLNRVMERPEIIPERIIAPEPIAVKPTSMPWAVRKQMLEREDRAKAAAQRNAAKPDKEVDNLERELKIVESAREESSGGGGGV